MKKMKLHLPGMLRLSVMLLVALLSVVAATAQTQTIKGTVVDDNGQPVTGATIRVKGGSQVTTSAENGSYTLLNVKTGASLIVSFTGFENFEVSTFGNGYTRIQLKRSTRSLDEVIVVGYGSRKKSEVTGAITSVKSSELLQTPVANLAQGLQGRVAGLQITQNNAAPGGSISVRLRGTN